MESELVATLSDAVRLSVLTARERAVLALGEADASVWAHDEMGLADRDRLGETLYWNRRQELRDAYIAALDAVRALTPEADNEQ